MERFIYVCVVSFLFSCSSDDISEQKEYVSVETSEQFPGGETTVFDQSGAAFEFSAPNLTNDDLLLFFTGNSLFEQNWVTAPASTTARDGLGPFFNSRACAGCHAFDGRGKTPDFDGEINHGLLLRLNTLTVDEYGAYEGDPIYGGQLQDQSITGVAIEGSFIIDYEEIDVEYPDGNTATLRSPAYIVKDLAYGALSSGTKISPRIANQMIGLGLLEAIEEQDLLGLADENDANNDGISGKVNKVYDYKNNETVIGRFGWKANQPSIKQQIAGAFLGDIGITSSIFPEENCTEGVDCESIPNGNTGDDNFELSEIALETVTFYSSTLAVPIRRDYDSDETLEGKQLFFDAKCVSCHSPKFVTGSHSIAALENQTIYPYTDLLLHDMGDALADGVPDFMATGNEWRTPPLWGIGLLQTVNKHTQLLHDGRARNVEEAILWHGGEAENSKQLFMNFTAAERQKVIDFINTL